MFPPRFRDASLIKISLLLGGVKVKGECNEQRGI